MMELTIKERVAYGVRFLDSVEPGWEDKVDLVKLNMAAGDRCVLGQVFGDYYDAAIKWFGSVDAPTARDYGFIARSHSMLREITEFHYLRDEWRRVIQERQDLKGAL
jgi:hypothetical protein